MTSERKPGRKGGDRTRGFLRLVSAGGVVYRIQDGQVEVLLCGRNEPRVWGLPKGKPQPGESLEETAAREVAEETGLQVQVEGEIGHIDYWLVQPEGRGRCFKTVHFFLMSPTGGSLEAHDREYDAVQWFTAEEAYRTLTYVNAVDIVRRAVESTRAQEAV